MRQNHGTLKTVQEMRPVTKEPLSDFGHLRKEKGICRPAMLLAGVDDRLDAGWDFSVNSLGYFGERHVVIECIGDLQSHWYLFRHGGEQKRGGLQKPCGRRECI